MNRFSFLIVLLVLVTPLFAQTKVKVRMSSGHTTTGILKEYHAGDFMILEVADSVHMRVPMSEVSKIKGMKYFSDRRETAPWTYYNYTTIGILFIRTDYGLDGLEWNLHSLQGVHINDFYKVGLGVGIDRYGNVSSMPLYAGGRAELSHKRVAPLVLANLGYGYLWEKENRSDFSGIDDLKGGLYWEFGGGMTIRNPSTSYSLSLSFKSQNTQIDYTVIDWWSGLEQTYVEKRVFKNIAFNFGISF